MPFFESGNVASFLIKRALNYIFSKTNIMDDGKKLIILKIGKEGQYGKKDVDQKDIVINITRQTELDILCQEYAQEKHL